MTPVIPTNPVAPWLGGKRNLAKRICARLDASPCATYAEPFVGMVSGRNFGVSKDRPGRFNLTTLEPMLEDLHTRLAGVVIECLDWSEFIPRYDGPGTLFYLDPPYWGCEDDYGRQMFARTDFQRLSETLQGIAGRFLMSINDVPEIRDLFAWAAIEEVTTTYTIAGGGKAREGRPELLISKN